MQGGSRAGVRAGSLDGARLGRGAGVARVRLTEGDGGSRHGHGSEGGSTEDRHPRARACGSLQVLGHGDTPYGRAAAIRLSVEDVHRTLLLDRRPNSVKHNPSARYGNTYGYTVRCSRNGML